MPSALQSLPERQLEPLVKAYRDAVRAKRMQAALGLGLVLGLLGLAAWTTQFDALLLAANADRLSSYFVRIFHLENGALAWTDPVEWFWGVLPEYNFRWLWSLWDTLLIAYLGTLFGTLGGFLLCFVASTNLAPSRAHVFFARRALEFFRSVPEIVFAMIFVAAFGLGALAGVLALSIHTMGALGKLFSDAVENIDMRPVDGLTATGASWWETNRYAVLPQVLPNFTSYVLWRFENNVRGASVMGLVGAGGIGQDLMEYIRKFYYSDISALLVLIVSLVVIIDVLTGRLRHFLLGQQEAR
jgi:phosphonate transport system permease protein